MGGGKIEESELVALAESLKKDIIDATTEPDTERASDLMNALCKHKTLPVEILEKTKIGKMLTKSIKSLNRHKRTSPEKEALEKIIAIGEQTLGRWKKAAERESEKKKTTESTTAVDDTEGLPPTVKVYHIRLAKQQKEIYKDPPMLPPDHVHIEDKTYSLPERDKRTGLLTFECGEDEDLIPLLRDFLPNRTPEEVMRMGSFGGTYFRPIVSAVTNVRYKAEEVLADTVDPKWIEGLDKKTMLTSSTYRNAVNKYKVKCGGSLGMWESSGWISDSDPYGWFQWYCRFYQGRRTWNEDVRQMQRWLKCAGPKGRFRSQLCNKILSANTSADDISISPVIRQTLLHWGLEITEDVLEKHRKRVGR